MKYETYREHLTELQLTIKDLQERIKKLESHRCGDSISRQEAINALDVGAELLRRVLDGTDVVGAERAKYEWGLGLIESCIADVKELSSAQPEPCEDTTSRPFHNITMSEVLEYIDRMPEDVWQEFVACLECRGWSLERKIAKWCGGDFA